MEVRTVADVGRTAAELLVGRVKQGTTDGRRFSMALSGGRTPWAVFEALSRADLPWDRVDIFQVDERVAPRGHSDRNLTHLHDALTSLVPAEVHPMPVDDDDIWAGAYRYGDQLPEVLDLVHLGLGDDGHTASLAPDDPVLEEHHCSVSLTDAYLGRVRMTLTYATLDTAAEIVWIISGEHKRDMLRRLVAGDHSIPAGRVNPERAIVITDIAL